MVLSVIDVEKLLRLRGVLSLTNVIDIFHVLIAIDVSYSKILKQIFHIKCDVSGFNFNSKEYLWLHFRTRFCLLLVMFVVSLLIQKNI